MKSVRLGKGQGFADEAGQPLAQRIVPAFHVSGLTTFFAYAAMCFIGKDLAVCLPEVVESQTPLVLVRNLVPQVPTGLFAAVANHESDDLARAATNRRPQPSFSALFQHERSGFIKFKHVVGLGGQQGILEVRQRRLDFPDPAGHGLPGDVEDTLQPAHTGTFLVRPQDRVLVLFVVDVLGFQNPIGTAVLAVILSIAAFVGAVSDDVGAATNAAAVSDGYLYVPSTKRLLASL